MEKLDFTQDLEFLADRVSDALNIFNNYGIKDNQLVIQYGKMSFLSLKLEEMENIQFPLATLRLRTRDMAASWQYVPVGFSQINESRGLLNDMMKAAHPSPKKNSLWYIDHTVKDTIGERVVLSETVERRGYLYKAIFSNGFEAYITLTPDENEYKKDHAIAAIYSISNRKKEIIGQMMTADECLLVLINMAMQTDQRMSEFINVVEQVGGKTSAPLSYRLPEESKDMVKAIFKNGYALELSIEDDKIFLEVIGRYNGESYSLSLMEYDDFNNLLEFTKSTATMDQFTVSENADDDDNEE